ncbi:MAG TPA: RusA family crossover junction endodeoxyribonuclease [Longimicrobium sp.]|nr:RusA family crossover junction endodeoxyribonuclease [Longimicrobium sp.]
MLPIEEPPETGLIAFDVAAPPVSFQATATRKAPILAAVGALVSPCRYLLSGDVKVAIRWRISERARYEGDGSADVDNIVKPILDALSGPSGILIDDCQVQELTCYWSGGYANPEREHLEIEIGFDPDEHVSKDGLLFLSLGRGLYFPLQRDFPGEVVLHQAEFVMECHRSAERIASLGADISTAHQLLPAQRVFHRSRIVAFPTTTMEELRERFR